MKKRVITITILVLVFVGLVLAVCGLNGLLTETLPSKEIVRFLCDAFYVAGVIYVCIGGLIWSSNEGFFDGIGYMVSNWKHSIFNNRRDWKKKESYQEYKTRRAEKTKGSRVNEAIIIGGASIFIASILLLVYHFAF